MRLSRKCFACAVALWLTALAPAGEGRKGERLTPLEKYVQEAQARAEAQPASPGSIYASGGRLADLGRDLRASQVDDIVTIVVADRASAVARGTTNSARKSSARAGIGALLGPTEVGGRAADLARLGGESELQGEGETSRSSVLMTTLSARVTNVLPNGNLVVEGGKDIWINSERQHVSVRGVIRWNDLGAGNMVRSDRLSQLEVRVNGKGVVGDAVRRPNFLYRLLLGLLPF